MKKHYENHWEEQRAKVIGLGEKSARKSYYPELQQRLLELDLVNKKLKKEIEERKRAEEELRESEERYRSLFQNNHSVMLIIDPENADIVDANPAAISYYGWSLEELTSKKTTDLNMLTAEQVFQEMEKAKSEQRRHFIFQHCLSNGDIRDVEVYSGPINLRGREFLYSIIHDITERKRAEKAQFEALARFYGFAEASQYGMGMADLDGHIVYVNSTLARMLGEKSPDDCLGKHFPTAYYSSMMTRKLQNEVMPALMRDGNWHGELELLTTDRRCVPTDENYFVIRDENGSPCYLADILTDITERKQAEEALRESEERYRLLVQHAPAGIYEFDMKTMKFISVNDVMCEYTGYTRDEFLALDPWELIADESKETRDGLLEEVFSGNPNPTPVEYKIKGKNNREFWVLVHSRFSFENGVPKKATAVVHDLTTIRRAQEEKKQLEAQLQQTQRMEAIGTLAGGIAHDFNNILSAIIGFTEISIGELERGSWLFNNLQKVLDAGDRAKDLVSQILAFSRQSDYKPKPVHVKLITNEALRLLRATLPTTIEIHQRLESNSAVMADPTQIHQIIMNLCTNAGSAMQEKGGKLDVSLIDVDLDSEFVDQYPDMNPGPYIELAVSDTGHGISPEIMERIFDPFFTTKEKGEGTGMGLSVVHGIINSFGGTITVDSEPRKGTTFNLYIPAIESETVLEPESPVPLPVGTERILFVDDEEFQVDLGEQMLKSLGYKVVTRTSSLEALELFRTKPNDFDLVITDITMPNMTGDKLAGELLRIRSDIPIILCTGFSAMIDEGKAKAMGIRAFIFKPILKREIAEAIRKVLDGK